VVGTVLIDGFLVTVLLLFVVGSRDDYWTKWR